MEIFLDIDKTVGALEHVIGYHHTAHDVETILRLGWVELDNILCNIILTI